MMTSKLYRYSLPLLIPHMKRREGLILQLEGDDGMRWCEAAPLPGLSEESLAEVEAGLQLFASSRFALKCASLPLTGKPVRVNALLTGSSIEEILARGKSARAEGFTSAKVKIAHLDFADAVILVKELEKHFRLRLDLNRKWPLEKTLHFLSHLSRFDYVEEPVTRFEDLHDFPYPFALDETVREKAAEQLFDLKNLKAVIIKPMMHEVDEIIPIAREQGWQVILSSSFETGIGLTYLAALTHHLQLDEIPMGFDTYRYFAQDILQKPLIYKNGMMYPPTEIEPNHELLIPCKNIDVRLLQEQSTPLI